MLVQIAIVVFIIAAIFGLIILTAILRNKETPKPAVLIHGPLAAVGLVLLIVDVVKGHTEALLVASLIIFILAAVGGFTLLAFDTLKKRIPKPLAILHPLIAICALVILIIYAVK